MCSRYGGLHIQIVLTNTKLGQVVKFYYLGRYCSNNEHQGGREEPQGRRRFWRLSGEGMEGEAYFCGSERVTHLMGCCANVLKLQGMDTKYYIEEESKCFRKKILEDSN